MLGTAYIMKAYTEANTAMEIHIYMLLLRVWGKNEQQIISSPSFCFALAFSGAFLVWYSSSTIIHTRSRICFRIWIFSFYLHQKILNLISFHCLRRNPCHSRSLNNFVTRECINILSRVTLFFKFTTRFRMYSTENHPHQNGLLVAIVFKFSASIAQLSTKLISEINQDLWRKFVYFLIEIRLK